MKTTFLSLLILIILAINGCYSPWNFTLDDDTKLIIGETKVEDVRKNFNRPREVINVNDTEVRTTIHKYYMQTGVGKYAIARVRLLFLEEKEGYLNGYIYASSISSEITDFDENKIDKIIIGSTKAYEVEKIYGKTPSEIRLPTNLLHIGLGIEESYQHPETATYAWIYGYQYLAGLSPKYMYPQDKFIIIFFDKDDSVVDFYHLLDILYPLM
ncbi:MAG TPA: hypothetical protein VLH59_07980 [Ignavibacteriaceae bacterium]|nr:hypothetical protein [Ignavibacteriaceae bacterium]